MLYYKAIAIIHFMLFRRRGNFPSAFVLKAGAINKDRIRQCALRSAEKGAYAYTNDAGTFTTEAWEDIWFHHYLSLFKTHREKFLDKDDYIILTCDGLGAHCLSVKVLLSMIEHKIIFYCFPGHYTRCARQLQFFFFELVRY